MASALDSLRKGYAQLTPFERANMMLQEATTNQREAVAEALVAPTLWDAYREAGLTCALVMLAGYALAQSLKADRARMATLAIAMRHRANEQSTVDGDEFDTRLEKSAVYRELAEAWMTALVKLEEETGGAFLAAAKLLDDTYPGEMLARSSARTSGPVDDADQLATLRRSWREMGAEEH